MAAVDKKEVKQPERTGFKFRYCLYIIIIVFLLLSLFSHSADDYAVIQGGSDAVIENWIGSFGAHLSCLLLYVFGLAAYPMILIFIICALRPFIPIPTRRTGYSGALAVLIIGITLLLAITPEVFTVQTEKLGIGRADKPAYALSGGALGQVLAAPQTTEFQAGYLRRFIGTVGTLVVAITFVLGGAVFIWIADWHGVMKCLVARMRTGVSTQPEEEKKPETKPQKAALLETPDLAPMPESEQKMWRADPKAEPVKIWQPEPVMQKMPEPKTEAAALQSPPPESRPRQKNAKGRTEYVLPPVTMLSKGPEESSESAAEIERSSQILQRTLESFNVDGQVTGIISGPRVTRYEISLSPGVKVEKVANIGNNIAMELEAESIRILAPIPGRNAVGVEAPNSRAASVFMRTVMESDAWKKNKCEIPIILGKDVAGNSIILDLAKAPHLMIAGATGSGKSVCMNTLIMSLLFNFSPDDLRLIMVDPKVVELETYKTLSHLITPVVNDPHKVPLALRWAVNEMEKRYRILAKAKVKNLKGYNTRPDSEAPILDDNGQSIPEKLPIIVIIIDELADVMMTDAKGDVETAIARIAQKGRAAGIHIVIATQRPSTNIITGVIKANLPTRIAFRVGSIVDSRVILDQKGAETLLGLGDMLFVPPGSPNLERIQGAYVNDLDIAKVVEFVSAQAEQSFDQKVIAEQAEEEIADFVDEDESGDDAESSVYDAAEIDPIVRKYLQPDDDELVRKSLEIILMERKASTSYLQRRLKIGYNRAAEIIDKLEQRGIVSPPLPGGSKRDILVFDGIANG